MASVNKCIFIGRAGRDPEVRYTGAGAAVASVSIACDYKTKDKEETEWVNLVFFDRLAEIAGEYIKKGDPIYVEARVRTRKYEKDGVDRYITEFIVMGLQLLGGRKDGDSGGRQERPAASRSSGSSQRREQPQQSSQTGFDDMDDDIPF